MNDSVIRNQLQESRVKFGKALKTWRKQNKWVQDTCMDWGQAYDMPHVYGSKWNLLEKATMSNPGPLVFHSLGIFNCAVHRGEFKGLNNRKLLARLQDSAAITNPDNQPWKGPEFFAAYIGALAWPKWIADGIQMSADDANEITKALRDEFEAFKKATNTKGDILLARLRSAEMPEDLKERMIEVLLKENDLTVADTALLNKGKESVLQSLNQALIIKGV